MATAEQFFTMMDIYGFPSQAFWRSFEFDLLKSLSLERPILEAGCSDGSFTKQLCGFAETAIDINPRALRIAETSGVYGSVRLQDAGTLQDDPEFRTILFNSVIEHIPEPNRVLAGSFRALLPGGRLVLTVPLADMNDHLMFRFRSYVRARQNRLSHVSLFTLNDWERMLTDTGFHVERTTRYLNPEAIRTWDRMDSTTMLGTARVNLGSIAFKLRKIVPVSVSRAVDRFFFRILSKHLQRKVAADGCAALIVAVKPVTVDVESRNRT